MGLVFTIRYFQIKKRLVNLISNLNFRNKSLKTFIFQKFSELDINEMNDKVNRMSASLKIENIKVKELYPGCFCIEKKQ